MLLDLTYYESPNLVQHSLLLLDRYYTTESDIFKNAFKSQLLKTTQSANFYNKVELLLLAHLRTGSAGSSSSTGDAHKSSLIQEFTQSCWLEGEVEGSEPHQINQNIILSFDGMCDSDNCMLKLTFF